MNLFNFHTYEKNAPYVYEVPVIDEAQGNIENYEIIIVGNYGNKYDFQLNSFSGMFFTCFGSNSIFTYNI